MDALKQALRRLAKAVVVITSRHETVRFAMSATAVSELSFDPPSMLVCVNRTASMYAPLAAGAPFAINILHHSQSAVAARCAGQLKGEARFAGRRVAGDRPEDTQARRRPGQHRVPQRQAG